MIEIKISGIYAKSESEMNTLIIESSQILQQ